MSPESLLIFHCLNETSPVVKLSKFGGSIGTLPQSESSLCQTYGSINGIWSFVSSKSGAQLSIDRSIRKRKNFQPMDDQRQDDKEVKTEPFWYGWNVWLRNRGITEQIVYPIISPPFPQPGYFKWVQGHRSNS